MVAKRVEAFLAGVSGRPERQPTTGCGLFAQLFGRICLRQDRGSSVVVVGEGEVRCVLHS